MINENYSTYRRRVNMKENLKQKEKYKKKTEKILEIPKKIEILTVKLDGGYPYPMRAYVL